MYLFFSNLITYLFYSLLFMVPLFFWPTSFELFEFNKMVLTYIFTVLIISFWIVKMILQRKIIFRRTIFDIPLLIFLSSQLLSTIISLDFRTSFLGYYSRFNNGFVSSICYSLLFWAFVSNMDKGKVKKSIYFLLASSFLVSLYGILQHFGIDKNIWVQDVKERVFSTLGQPNWLAAWIAALLPLTWALDLIQRIKFPKEKRGKIKNYIWTGLSAILFITLLFTKSRSGILGLGVSSLIFWVLGFGLTLKKILNKKIFVKSFLIQNILFAIIALVVGTPWTVGITKIIQGKPKVIGNQEQVVKTQGPALETGGTESGTIRKIVWKGAIEIWKHYPILGSGVETFAFSFYNFRPVEHNLVSEWDFLYNKAHNEYLNILATTGIVGLMSNLLLIATFVFLVIKGILYIKKERKNGKEKEELDTKNILPLAIISGFASIPVTNFFGFSVVAVNLLFFLYPGMLILLNNNFDVEEKKDNVKTPNSKQKILLTTVLITCFYLLLSIGRYWLADLNYANGKKLNDFKNFSSARKHLIKAVSLSPKEAIFVGELSENSADIAIALSEKIKKEDLNQAIQSAITESDKALSLSPKNLSILRQRTIVFLKLSTLNPTFLTNAKNTLEESVKLAPTDAKLWYNLGLVYSRTNNTDLAIETLSKTVGMKANYKEARLALALFLKEKGEKEKARQELEYILKNIAPEDKMAQEQLKDL